MARKIDRLPQTERKWHGVERPYLGDKQSNIERALNEHTIDEDEAKELAELSDDDVITYLNENRAAIQEEDDKSKPIASFVVGHNMSLDEAINTFEIQHLTWTLSHRVMQVRDTHRRMAEWGKEVAHHQHSITITNGPRPMPEYSPDPITYYNRACEDYRITADVVNSALSHFGVGEEDRRTIIGRAITSGLLQYR